MNQTEKQFLKAINQDPYNMLKVVNYAAWLAENQQYDSSEMYYKKALKIKETSAVHYNLAIMLKKNNKISQAISHFEAAKKIDPNATYIDNILAETYLSDGRFLQSVLAYKQVIKKQPKNFIPYLQVGQIQLLLKNLQDAQYHLRQSIKIKPLNSTAHLKLSLVFELTGRVQESLNEAKIAVQINPQNFQNQLRLAQMYKKSFKDSEAQLHFKYALELKPYHIEANITYGMMLFRQGKLQEAKKCLNNALKYAPDYYLSYCNLGILFEKENNTEQAVKNFQKVYNLEPNFQQNSRLLALMYQFLNRFKEAEPIFDHMSKQNPLNLVYGAQNKEVLGHKKQAFQMLKKAKNIMSKTPDSELSKKFQLNNKQISIIRQRSKSLDIFYAKSQEQGIENMENDLINSQRSEKDLQNHILVEIEVYKAEIIEAVNKKMEKKYGEKIINLQNQINQMKQEFEDEIQFRDIVKNLETNGNIRIAKFGKNLCWILYSSIQAYRHIGLGLVQGGGTGISNTEQKVRKIAKGLQIGSNIPIIGDFCGIIAQIFNLCLEQDMKVVIKRIIVVTDQLYSERLLNKAILQTVVFLLKKQQFISSIMQTQQGKWYQRLISRLKGLKQKAIRRMKSMEQNKFDEEMDLAMEYSALIFYNLVKQKGHFDQNSNPLLVAAEIMIEQ